MDKIRTRPQLVMIGAVVALISSTMPTTVLAAEYTPGFQWNRAMDWVPGTIPGSTAGNPSSDTNGAPAWFYGYTSGGELGSENPWYAQELSPMVWDDDWANSPTVGAWARGYNGPGENNIGTNPPIDKWAMAHDLSEVTQSAAYIPVAEWRNPAGDGAVINALGSLSVNWYGIYQENAPVAPIDIAVARMDASTGSADLLYSTTLTNPSEGGTLLYPGYPGFEDTPSTEIKNTWGVTELRMDEGDTLRFTLRMRGDEADPPLWGLLQDHTRITLTSVVPEPEQYAMLALGLGVLAVRLRRRPLASYVN